MSTSEPEQGSPSFFKVIRYPSAAHLALPTAFVKRYWNKIPKNPTLVTATGKHSWKMKFVKIGEDYCFAHGWEQLVKDVGLCIRDIVVFWLVDPLTFRVCFLGANECEKVLPVIKSKDVEDDDDVVDQCHDDEDLCFKKSINWKRYRYYLPLPIKFVRAAGLELKKSVKLKDHEGKVWTMGILIQRYTGIKYGLSAGWARFLNYHMFLDGDVCAFTFDKQEGIINVTPLFKSKRPIKQETLLEEVKRTQSCYGNGNVLIEDECSPTEKPCGGGGSGSGVKVKTEYEWDPGMEVGMRKRARSPLKRCAEAKIGYDWVPERVVRKPKSGTLQPEKPSRGGGVEVNTELETESVFRSKCVVYF